MNSRRKKILVVDDNPVNHEIVQEILGNRHEILLAGTAREALQLAAKHEPRIVLLDVMLPDSDGYEVCRILREMAEVSHARIVMVTAKAMPSERTKGFSAGADAYLTKPFDAVELLSAISSPADETASSDANCGYEFDMEHC